MAETRISSDSPGDLLISVITAVFNGAEYLEQTIQSVLTQSYPNLEHIIIDGGSWDGTVEIIRKYASHLTYWHSKPDRGLSHAFNLGIAQARGQWIIFLNADDFFLDPLVVGKMVPYLIAHEEFDVIFGNTIIMTRQKGITSSPLAKSYGHPWRWKEFRRVDTIPHQSAFNSRRYIERVGNFDESFRIAMDYDLYLRGRENLLARYIPLKVTGMRDGGLSRLSAIYALSEARVAQQKNKACSTLLAWLNFFWQVGRISAAKVAHRILDPIALKVAYARKAKGEFL
jgi:glycosyltransferase involved in cell wall biosynthesis